MKRTCIFCGSDGKLSDEHIISKWIQKHVPKFDSKSLYQSMEAKTLPGRYSVATRAGDPLSETRKIVCLECNNGWMSKIVKEAQPDIEPLLYGKWEELTPAGQIRIAEWAILTTMINDKTLDVPVTPHDEYRDIYNTKQPSAAWRVWIGVASEEVKTVWISRTFATLSEQYSFNVIGLMVGRFVFVVAGAKPHAFLQLCKMPPDAPFVEIFPNSTAAAKPIPVSEETTTRAIDTMGELTFRAVAAQRRKRAFASSTTLTRRPF